MSKVLILIDDADLPAIANKIRSKLGVSTLYKPSEMAGAIESIGGITPTGTINIVQNGTTDVTQYASASVNVPNSYSASDEGKVVSNGALVAQTARVSEITENGTYDTTKNNSITVNVGSSPSVLSKMVFWGDAMFNTGVLSDTSDLKVKIRIKLKSVNSTMGILGSEWTERGFLLIIYGQKFRFHSGGVLIDSGSIVANMWYDIELSKTGMTVNNQYYELPTHSLDDVSLSITVGSAVHAQGLFASMILAECKMFSGNTALRDFVPTNQNSFYDNITGNTFANSISGTLLSCTGD